MNARLILFVASALLPVTAYGQQAPAIADDIKELKAMVQALTDQQKADKADLEKKITALFEGQREHDIQIGDIAKKDNSGRSYIKLDTQHDPTKRELQSAIVAVTPTEGTVIIDNQTDRDEYVVVNGTQYFVMRQSKFPVKDVPVGKYTYRARGERDKTGVLLPNGKADVISIVRQPSPPVIIWPYYSTYYVSY
jgi:hypothetical protein